MKSHWPQKARAITAIGEVTFHEILRDKLLYNIILFALVVFGMGILAAQLTYGYPQRIVLHFGLSGLAISCGMIAILAGASMLNREIERRTIHVALSRPLSRPDFLLGKYLGLAGVIALNWFLMSMALMLMASIFAAIAGMGASSILLNPAMHISLLFLLLQSLVLGSMTVFFSSFTTPSIAVIISFGFYLIGANLSELRLAAEKIGSSASTVIKLAVAVLPGFDRFSPGTRAIYGLPPGLGECLAIVLYGCLLTGFFLLSAGFLIRRREI